MALSRYAKTMLRARDAYQRTGCEISRLTAQRMFIILCEIELFKTKPENKGWISVRPDARCPFTQAIRKEWELRRT